MTLSEQQKKKIEEEEQYRKELRAGKSNKKRWYQKTGWIIALLILFFPVGLFLMWKYAMWSKIIKWIITAVFAFAIIISAITPTPNKPLPSKTDNSKQTLQTQKTQEQSTSDIKVNDQIVSVGDTADSVFAIITDKYKINFPTIQKGKITHHFLDGKTLFDMTFEKNDNEDYYILSKIMIMDTNYQVSSEQETPPQAQYMVGYTSGFLATVVVPKGITNKQLVELLNYYHNLHKNGELSKTMKGHTIIDIFDDESWVVKENYERIIRDGTYCDYIKATYTIDISGVESAYIGSGNCPNNEKITF